MPTPYENFLFSELRSSRARQDFKHLEDIVRLGFRMYEASQMREYLSVFTAEEIPHILRVIPRPLYCEMMWPPEFFTNGVTYEDVAKSSEFSYQIADLNNPKGPVEAWKSLMDKNSGNLFWWNRQALVIGRIWLYWGWLKYRAPTPKDMTLLTARWANNKAGRKPSNWNRVFSQIPSEKDPNPQPFTMEHSWMLIVKEEAEQWLGFTKEDDHE